jgi:hypothetical protein
MDCSQERLLPLTHCLQLGLPSSCRSNSSFAITLMDMVGFDNARVCGRSVSEFFDRARAGSTRHEETNFGAPRSRWPRPMPAARTHTAAAPSPPLRSLMNPEGAWSSSFSSSLLVPS